MINLKPCALRGHCAHDAAPRLAVGPSLLRALWYGMRCLTMSEIRRWDAAHFNVSSRHFCSRSTSFPSALEVFHDNALYKFTIDIDIDIDIKYGQNNEG